MTEKFPAAQGRQEMKRSEMYLNKKSIYTEYGCRQAGDGEDADDE